MRTDRPDMQVGADSWVGYVLGTIGCLKEGYQLGYDKDGIHYTYLDRVEWLCRCGVAPYVEELQKEVAILRDSINADGICEATIDENQLKGLSTYGGQQLEVDWKNPVRKLCDITFRVLMILNYAIIGNLSFSEELPLHNLEVIEAMEEAKIISKDFSTKRYSSFSEALEDL